MVYIVDREQKALLSALGERVGECWVGLTLLPDQRNFEIARTRAVNNIRHIAGIRERACAEIERALAAETP